MSSGFIDIQVNGYAGVDFQRPVTEAQMQKVVQHLQQDRVEAIMPTIITNHLDDLEKLITGMLAMIDKLGVQKLMPALHIEGPGISPEEGYRGAHLPAAIRPPQVDWMKRVIDAGQGRIGMITLAPEFDEGLQTTRWLAEQGIVVAAGHTNAPLEVLRDAVDAGLKTFTHLSNGCANLIPRHDNVINRAMSIEKLKLSMIPDGHHIPFWLLKNWVKWLGTDRLIFTTDCASPASAPPGRYTIAQWDIEVGEDRLVRPAGENHLAGSALTMAEAYDNAINKLGLPEADARALTIDNPRKLMGDWLK